MTPPIDRSLTTTLYSGEVVRTGWPAVQRWSLAAQCAHAEQHRKSVRSRLLLTGQARMIPEEMLP